MQNAECIMQNDSVGFADLLKMIAEGNSTILHFAFCIMHYPFITMARSAWRTISSVEAVGSTPFRAAWISAGE